MLKDPSQLRIEEKKEKEEILFRSYEGWLGKIWISVLPIMRTENFLLKIFSRQTYWVVASLLALEFMCSMNVGLDNEWDKAEQEIKHIAPKAFTQLSAEIVKRLKEVGCLIPQSFTDPKPHNVVSGMFAKKGQVDWAVLCSSSGASSIVVLWGGPSKCPNKLATEKDGTYLQGIGDGKVGYSRVISPVSKDYIMDHFRAYGGTRPPTIRHQGIDDAFVGKASVVHYCYKSKWLELTGAD